MQFGKGRPTGAQTGEAGRGAHPGPSACGGAHLASSSSASTLRRCAAPACRQKPKWSMINLVAPDAPSSERRPGSASATPPKAITPTGMPSSPARAKSARPTSPPRPPSTWANCGPLKRTPLNPRPWSVSSAARAILGPAAGSTIPIARKKPGCRCSAACTYSWSVPRITSARFQAKLWWTMSAPSMPAALAQLTKRSMVATLGSGGAEGTRAGAVA